MKETLKIVLRQKIDLVLFAGFIAALFIGVGKNDVILLGGALLIAIGNKLFDFINKIILIKRGIIE